MDKRENLAPPLSLENEKPRVVFLLRLLSGGATLGGIFAVAGGSEPFFSARARAAWPPVLANPTAFSCYAAVHEPADLRTLKADQQVLRAAVEAIREHARIIER